MPSVAQESPTVQSSKKRRRDDNPLQIPLAHSPNNTPRVIFSDKTFDHNTGQFHHHHSSPLLPRKIIPLPPGKRQRTTADIDVEAEDEPMQRSPSSSPSHRHDHLHHHERQQHRRHHSKRPSQQHQHDLDEKTRSLPPLMSRCHICSRKPNKKSDLDSFADCQGCGQRTCYVCIRECLGWSPPSNQPAVASKPQLSHDPIATTPLLEEEGETSFTMLDADAAEDQHQPHQPPQPTEPSRGESGHGQGWTRGGGHRQVVCSRCCIERGQDGEVVCLGCLPFVEG